VNLERRARAKDTYVDDLERSEHGYLRMQLDDIVVSCLEHLKVLLFVPCNRVTSSPSSSTEGTGRRWQSRWRRDEYERLGLHAEMDVEEFERETG
jgi:hypothetical protein